MSAAAFAIEVQLEPKDAPNEADVLRDCQQDQVKEFLDSYKESPPRPSDSSGGLLGRVVASECRAAIDLLFARGVTEAQLNAALQNAVYRMSAFDIRLLIERGADPGSGDPKRVVCLDGPDADENCGGEVRYILDQALKAASPRIRLLEAARKGDLAEARDSIAKGAKADAREGSRDLPALTLAAGMENLELVRFLVEKGADVNAVNAEGWTALMAAARKGSLDIVRFLLDKGAALDAKDRFGNTAAMEAARGQYVSVVRLIIGRGAKPLKEMSDQDALDLSRGEPDIAALLTGRTPKTEP